MGAKDQRLSIDIKWKFSLFYFLFFFFKV